MNEMPILMSMKDTVKLTSLSRSAINMARSNGQFPAAVMLGEKRIAFVRTEIIDWIEARIAGRAQYK